MIKELIITESLIARFWAKVYKTNSCWLWSASLNEDRYGKFRCAGKSEFAHRVSWTIHFGPIPEGKYVCHNCPGGDNPGCVNPAHLWLGTHVDNMEDMDAKGRRSTARARGEQHWKNKLTEAQVLEIRSSVGETLQVLADRYGISFQHVHAIKQHRSWKHL